MTETTHTALTQAPVKVKLFFGIPSLLALLMLGSAAHAQVVRCTDAKTGEITYTNGRCVGNESSLQIQAAQSAEEIASERANASKALERSKSEIARDDALRRQREEKDRKERAAAEKAQARANTNLESSPACRQARARHNAILAESNPDQSTWSERSQAAQVQMEMNCLGAAGYQQLQQSRALQPNTINRPQWGYRHSSQGYYPPARPMPVQPPAHITNCNVFRCYDSRGGVHPIP